jgi:hypothetical protein
MLMKLEKTGLRLWHAGVFAAVLAATLVAASPARWAAAAVERASDGRVRIAAATGTAWSGRGDVVVRTDGGEVTLRGAVWKWLPARVLAGELAFEVRAEHAAGPGGMVVAWGLAGAVLRGADTLFFHGRPT